MCEELNSYLLQLEQKFAIALNQALFPKGRSVYLREVYGVDDEIEEGDE